MGGLKIEKERRLSPIHSFPARLIDWGKSPTEKRVLHLSHMGMGPRLLAQLADHEAESKSAGVTPVCMDLPG